MKKEYPEWLGKKISTNEKGFDFFVDEIPNESAQQRLGKEYNVLIIGKDGNLIERILVDGERKVLYACTDMESMGVHIDALYAIKLRK